MDNVIYVEGFDANLAPDAFHMWAMHYYECKQQFKPPRDFSPVPYFLLCRAIELEIKSRHLREKKQDEVKDKFGHKLIKAYEALNPKEQILSIEELDILQQADNIYYRKDFEYFEPEDVASGYSRYPDLQMLDRVAEKLIRQSPT